MEDKIEALRAALLRFVVISRCLCLGLDDALCPCCEGKKVLEDTSTLALGPKYPKRAKI